ncbi:9398_t:CDS:2 [Acaulospora morrowiae]|uniref:Malic enzyme n=1 Tax=Acaulospora morrowiae TaxID=94023 RepID=A0A9N8WN64_9GLOM|nr:9398_t:CDS:2 [Acaulospora morrowiae]
MPNMYTNGKHTSSILESVARSPYLNQGTAASHSVRKSLKVSGHLPAAVESLDQQKRLAMQQLRSKSTDLEKYMFLAWLRNTNIRLFYRIVIDELEEVTPLIYTPTVGTACLEYSHIYPFLAPPGVPDGLYLSIDDKPNLTQIIKNYRPYPFDSSLTPQITVITDGSRILGLGDLGVNGMGIPIGKLQLYVAGAGIDPRLYPDILIQFEDFSSEHAFSLLSKYRENTFCFNDDIQGTGAVILSGFINAVRLVEKDVPPTQHRLLFFGAGSAAVGVARQLLEFFKIEHGMSEEEAKKLVWLVDTKGLVTRDRGDKLADHKVYFARSDNEGRQYKTLYDVIEYVKPTALIGLSSTGGVFNEQVIKRMGELNKNPIIFPLSNPMVNAECTYEDAMRLTNNRVIFASGTAFPHYVEPDSGRIRYPGQGNNMYIFPGLGLGAILARPAIITDRQIYASSSALATALTEEEVSQDLMYPVVQRIRHVSAEVAAAVIVEAVDEGLARNPEVVSMVKRDCGELKTRRGKKWESLVEYVEEHMWDPNNEKFFELNNLIGSKI